MMFLVYMFVLFASCMESAAPATTKQPALRSSVLNLDVKDAEANYQWWTYTIGQDVPAQNGYKAANAPFLLERETLESGNEYLNIKKADGSIVCVLALADALKSGAHYIPYFRFGTKDGATKIMAAIGHARNHSLSMIAWDVSAACAEKQS